VSALVALVRVALGATFLAAAATKLPDMAAFAEVLANYRLVPAPLVPAAAAVVIGVELVVGALLVLGRNARAAALLAAGMLALFAAGLASALARGIDLRCGCFGGQESASWATVLRDVGLLAAAALVAARGPGRIVPPSGAPGARRSLSGPGGSNAA
jgi:putative oxidoreductase